ncbi:hypothetical protein PROPEN_02924 [Proteus penneri ATCC 35198]|nr:hypothetical protein PROPEN_02924 [Proteus penneri ATCC 35198]
MVKARKKGIAQSVSRQLQDENGKIYQIGDLIKSGGAGSVSHINNVPSQVSKVYHDKIDKAYYLKKNHGNAEVRTCIKACFC